MNPIEPTSYYGGETKAAETISLYTLLNIIFKRKFVIISVFTSIVATVTIGTMRMPPIYQASSKILVEREADSEKSLLFRMNLNLAFEQHDWINSEVQIIQSIPVALKVIEKLKLDRTAPGKKQPDANQVLGTFKAGLKVANAKDSNIIDISYESGEPAVAAQIIDTLIAAYIDYRSFLASESEAYQFFDNQINIAEQELSKLEERQKQFKQSEEVISPQVQGDMLLTKVADYERALTDVRTRRIGKEAMLSVIKDQVMKGAGVNIPVTESSDSPSREKYITKLRGELLDLELRRDQLLQKYTAEYDQVVHLEETITSTRSHIDREIDEIVELEQTSIRALKAEEAALDSTIQVLNNQIREFAQKEYEFTKLSRGIADNREVYSMLVKQREEARISQAKLERGVKIKVISPALVPTTPIKPQKKLNVLLAIILGLVSGFGLAFFVEYFDHSVNSPKEVEDRLKLPVWGSIKKLPLKPGQEASTKLLA